MTPKIELQKINEIILCPDPVLRNLQITQTYSEINQALSKLLGKNNVSWCAYATWASKTAGRFIRLENVDAAIAEFLRGKDWMQEILDALPRAFNWFAQKVQIKPSFLLKILNETAQASAAEVGRGNLLVFCGIGSFVRALFTIDFCQSRAAPSRTGSFFAAFKTNPKRRRRPTKTNSSLYCLPNCYF